MSVTTRPFIAALALFTLAACGSSESADGETEMTETSADADDIPAEETVRTEIVGDPAAGERVFAQCAVCHAVEPDRNGLGPSLHGVVGRTAAAVDGFNYSPAMQESDIVWSAEALDEYIENPRAAIPGNRMAFAGVRDEQARADVLAYLETLR